MLWAVATMCFFGFLRSGEVVVPGESGFDSTVHLAHGDVKVSSYEDPSFVEVTIKASKMDPYPGRGLRSIWAELRQTSAQ